MRLQQNKWVSKMYLKLTQKDLTGFCLRFANMTPSKPVLGRSHSLQTTVTQHRVSVALNVFQDAMFSRILVSFSLCLNGIVAMLLFTPVEAQSSLHMHWELPKTLYVVGEEIQPIGCLKNDSDSSVAYSWRDIREYVLMNLTKVKQEKRRFGVLSDDGPFLLRPGDSSDYVTPQLLTMYGNGSYAGRFYLLPGSYAFCSAQFSSDTVFFVVREPTSELDIAAWKTLRSALDSSHTVLSSMSMTYAYYKKYLNDFSGSTYVPRALSQLASLLPEEVPGFSVEERSSYANRLILNYPQSPYNSAVLYLVDYSLLTSEERDSLENALSLMLQDNRPAADAKLIRKALAGKTPILRPEYRDDY